jgi:hypothetical protein
MILFQGIITPTPRNFKASERILLQNFSASIRGHVLLMLITGLDLEEILAEDTSDSN